MQGPVHFLVIPKHRNGLTRLANCTDEHKEQLGHLMVVAAKVGGGRGAHELGRAAADPCHRAVLRCRHEVVGALRGCRPDTCSETSFLSAPVVELQRQPPPFLPSPSLSLQVAKQEGLADGYRVVVNDGKNGAQTVGASKSCGAGVVPMLYRKGGGAVCLHPGVGSGRCPGTRLPPSPPPLYLPTN